MEGSQYLALARHGKSFANAALEKTGDGLHFAVSGSDLEVGITPEGESESERAGRLLFRLFPRHSPLVQIWQSQFRRVEQSSSKIAQCFDYPITPIVDPRLNKRNYGTFWNLTYEGVRVLHPDEYDIYNALGPLKYRPPNGENFYDLFERVDDFMISTLNQSVGNQLVVGHSAVILAMQRNLDGLPDREVVQQYEAVSIPNGHILLYRRDNMTEPWKRVLPTDCLGDNVHYISSPNPTDIRRRSRA